MRLPLQALLLATLLCVAYGLILYLYDPAGPSALPQAPGFLVGRKETLRALTAANQWLTPMRAITGRCRPDQRMPHPNRN